MNIEGMYVQEFISLSVTRQLAVKLGEDDPALGEPWSSVYDDPKFLDLLQKVGRDQLDDVGIREYWMFLHVGSEKPN